MCGYACIGCGRCGKKPDRILPPFCCPACGGPVEAGADACPACGLSLVPGEPLGVRRGTLRDGQAEAGGDAVASSPA